MATDNILKDAFAAELLRCPDEPYRAALKLVGNNISRALQISSEWPRDMYVLTKQAELLEKLGEDHFLPNKAMLARRIWDVAETSTDRKDKLAAYKLFAEVRGYIQKSDINVNNNIALTQNRVMVVKDHGSNEDWELRATAQQTKLIEHARD